MHWGIFGHQWAVQLIKEHICRNQLRHAYLITGPMGVGRRTLAISLAQAVNCPQPSEAGEPCRTCITCKRIKEMAHPDLSIIQSENGGRVIRVDQIRSLQHTLALTPYEGKYRIGLLLRFEEAHISAANALLKTLEEPNPQVILLMTASSPETLLPTIVSRCEHLRLRPLPLSDLARNLQDQLALPPDQAELYAHISNGRPGHAIELHHNPELLNKRSEHLQDLLRMISASRQERFAYADIIAREKDSVWYLLNIWITFWRDLLLMSSKTNAPITNLDYYSQIENLSNRIDVKNIFNYLVQIEHTVDSIDKNVNLRLALEVLFLDLPQLPEIIVS